MDANWFKQQQKRTGVTSDILGTALGRDRTVVSRIYHGKQRMTFEQAKVFSEVLGLSLATVLEKAGVTDAQTAQKLSPGFAESDAAPWIGKGPNDRQVPTIADALGARPGVDIWRISSTAMALAGYLPGDFMLVDTHQAERAKPGDVVIAQVYTRTGAKTVLRRWQPPVLVTAAPPGDDDQVYVVDNENVVIRGKVTASWRLPDRPSNPRINPS